MKRSHEAEKRGDGDTLFYSNIDYIYFTSMFLCVWVREPQHTYGGQRTVHRHQASLSVTWVLELKLRWASLSASTFTHCATSVYSLNFSSDMYVHAVAHMHMCLLSYVLSLMHTWVPVCALIHACCGTLACCKKSSGLRSHRDPGSPASLHPK